MENIIPSNTRWKENRSNMIILSSKPNKYRKEGGKKVQAIKPAHLTKHHGQYILHGTSKG